MITRTDFHDIVIGDEIILPGDERWLVTKANADRFVHCDMNHLSSGLHLEREVREDLAVHLVVVAWNDIIALGPIGVWSVYGGGYHRGFNDPLTVINKKVDEV